MNKNSKNVYIACSVIKAKQLDFAFLDLLIDFVKHHDFNPFVPGKMDDAPSKIIFDRDLKWLRQSNLIIADVNEPSHGTGMEIMYGYEHNIPVICLIHEKNKPLSRMIEGSPHVYIIEYSDKDELCHKLSELSLDELEISDCKECYAKTFHHFGKCQKC